MIFKRKKSAEAALTLQFSDIRSAYREWAKSYASQMRWSEFKDKYMQK